jgi:aminoglycoside 3-N-acetyltransferase
MTNSALRPSGKGFEEIAAGDCISFAVSVSAAEHTLFQQLTGDSSPIHQDPDFARTTAFARPIGYGFQLSSLLSRVYGMLLPGGTSICIKQESQFIRPFFPDDTILVKAEVIRKIQSTRFVEIRTEMFREQTECVFRGVGTVQVLFTRARISPLYICGSRSLFVGDLVEGARNVGLSEGDTVFIHSDIAAWGKLAIPDRALLLRAHLEALREVVGTSGTLIFPTFSYSFCNGEVFDVQETPSKVGILTEYFRRSPDVIRSRHPIFSVAAQGPLAAEMCHSGPDCFGDGSIFGALRRHNAKLLFWGAPFHSCTFIHHIEQIHGVSYRYCKTFSGTVRENGRDTVADATYFVRCLEKNVVLDTDPFEAVLLEQGMMRVAMVGAGRILCGTAETLFREGCRRLEATPHFFLKEPV